MYRTKWKLKYIAFQNFDQVRDQVNASTAKKHIFRKGDNSRAVAEMSEPSFYSQHSFGRFK